MAINQGVRLDIGRPIGPPGTQSPTMSGGGSPLRSLYDSAATTQAQDYDDIMRGYDDVLNTSKQNSSTGKIAFSPMSAIKQEAAPEYQYKRSNDFGSTISGLQDFSRTGGFSEGDLGNIRSRAMSPLRAAYSNAERNLARQTVLQGGYSPNKGALLAKMAREQGGLASQTANDTEAGIAQMVQQGKLAGFSQLSPLVSGENTMINNIGQNNTNAQRAVNEGNITDERGVRDANTTLRMRADEFNANQDQNSIQEMMAALSGKTNLYGTTPALVNTFGNQVLQNNQQNMSAVQTANAIKNQRAGLGIDLINSGLRLG